MFMFEKAVVGSRRYWTWIGALFAIIFVGFLCYVWEHEVGLGITGLSRDLVWGLYIAQFVFLVGVAASAVVVVLPYYLHDWKAFGKIVILGEFLAVSAVTMAGLFILANLGQPMRVFNVILYPSPSSLIFWDLVVLVGYLLLNALITLVALSAERKGVAPPTWIRPIIILSIPWAVSIHTVTAFLFSGLPGRSFWLTGLLAPRFLASAFASGPAFLILLTMAIRRLAGFDPGREAIRQLSLIVTYTMVINVFFAMVEAFTVFYSQIPEHMAHYEFLFLGLEGHAPLAVWMWTSMILAVISLVLLITPRYRNNEKILAVTCGMVFLSLWIDKGLGVIVGGFVPSPLGHVTSYVPTLPEIAITLAIWAVGFLMITVFYKIALSVREGLAG
jgi:molybdopterin-containing oxidoreductase family membrane subunit